MSYPYTSRTEIEQELPTQKIIQLCDDERSVNNDLGTLAQAEIDNSAITARIDRIIARVNGEVDAYCRKRFLPPIEDENGDTPAMIVNLATDLAVYWLHMRRKSEMDVPEQIRRMYEDAIDALKGIMAGKVDPGVDPQPAKSSAVKAEFATAAEYVEGTSAFTRETLEDF